MKIPKKFEFMGKTYSVAFEDLGELEKWGITDFVACHIRIETRLPQQTKEQTFLHELLHVIIFEMGVDKALKLNNIFEEKLVNAISNGLYAALKGIH